MWRDSVQMLILQCHIQRTVQLSPPVFIARLLRDADCRYTSDIREPPRHAGYIQSHDTPYLKYILWSYVILMKAT